MKNSHQIISFQHLNLKIVEDIDLIFSYSLYKDMVIDQGRILFQYNEFLTRSGPFIAMQNLQNACYSWSWDTNFHVCYVYEEPQIQIFKKIWKITEASTAKNTISSILENKYCFKFKGMKLQYVKSVCILVFFSFSRFP